MLTFKGFTAEKIQSAQVPGSGGGDVEGPYDPTIFQYKWSNTVTANTITFAAPPEGVSPSTVEIDWGDGTPVESKTVTAAETVRHQYADPLPSEELTVTIKLVNGELFPYTTPDRLGVTELLTPLPRMMGVTNLIPKCTSYKLLRSVCSRFFRNYADISDKLVLNAYFNFCDELTTIPVDLFQDLKIYNFSDMFRRSTKLQIPAGLLYIKPELVVEGATYNYTNFCRSMEAVPPYIFGKTEQEQKECLEYISSKSNLTFDYMFAGETTAKQSTGVAPHLWEYNYTNTVSHRYVFMNFSGENAGDIPSNWVTV